ncbi:hypothetical protein [Burkholderia glumae]
MTAQESKRYGQSPEQRIAFLESVEHYVNKRPMWTPAEGALLVNGVMPPLKGCMDIPEDARQLDDILQPATQSQLLGARMLLRAYRKDVDSGQASPAERITSDEFLEWCKDGDFLPLWRQKLAEFLRHLYFPGDVHNQYSQTVKDEIATLRLAMAAKEMQGALVSHVRAAEPRVDEAIPPSLQVNVGSDTTTVYASSLPETIGLKRREQQIQIILARIHELGWDPMKIQDNGKAELQTWCKENYPSVFGRGNDPFKDAWKEARKRNLVRMANQARFVARR